MTFWSFFSLNGPSGPDTPWGNPTLCVLDTLRLIIIVLGLLCLLDTPRLIYLSTVLGQRIRILACTLFSIVAILTEYNHIGDYAHWRLAVNLIATVCMSWGYWSFQRWETGPTYSNKSGSDGAA